MGSSAAVHRSAGPELVTGTSIGQELKRLRSASGRSLADVAAECALSTSFLSLVENDKSDITLRRLGRLVEVYGISIADLLHTLPAGDEHIVRRQERQLFHSPANGIDVYLLVRETDFAMMPQILEIRPRASTAEFGQHVGEEWIYVVAGEVELEVKGLPTRILSVDDSAYYNAELPHRFRNPSAEVMSRLICVNTPPNL